MVYLVEDDQRKRGDPVGIGVPVFFGGCDDGWAELGIELLAKRRIEAAGFPAALVSGSEALPVGRTLNESTEVRLVDLEEEPGELGAALDTQILPHHGPLDGKRGKYRAALLHHGVKCALRAIEALAVAGKAFGDFEFAEWGFEVLQPFTPGIGATLSTQRITRMLPTKPSVMAMIPKMDQTGIT